MSKRGKKDMTKDIMEKFLTWAKAKGWIVEFAKSAMELPEEVIVRYSNIPKLWYEFIVNFDTIINSTEDMWFLTCDNFLDGVWSYNDFENMSLEVADGDEEWSAEIKEFWDNNFPIIMSVGGDYQYYAIELDSGKIVQGWEPEFESPFVVAESFAEFIEKIVSGEIELIC